MTLCVFVWIGSQDPLPSSPLESLQFELKMYNPELSSRVGLVLANKMDLLSADEGKEEMERLERSSGLPVAPVSALKMISQHGRWWNKEQLNKALFRIE